MKIHSGQDLLEICSASSAAKFLTDLVAPTEGEPRTTMSYNYSSASSDSEEEEEDPLKSITISVDQLCRKLKKINHRFTW